MSTTLKAFVIVVLFGIAIALVALNQPSLEQSICVLVATSPQGAKHEEKIVLKAALNGSGLSHGQVRLDFTPTNPKGLASYSRYRYLIKGYTDGQGLFITAGPAFPPGEYMITASVNKVGCIEGRSVCFLCVPESGQDRLLPKAPISISSSKRPGG